MARAKQTDGNEAETEKTEAPVEAPAETVTETTSETAVEAENQQPANIPAATEFEASGAPLQIVPDVDPSHPAVDADPRANTSVLQNRIDFNDPDLTAAAAVAKNLEEQSKA